jgi:hypothetical protein
MEVRESESDRRPFWAGVGVYAMLGWRPQCDKNRWSLLNVVVHCPSALQMPRFVQCIQIEIYYMGIYMILVDYRQDQFAFFVISWR